MYINRKIERILTKTIIYGGLLFLILQLSTCYPSIGYPFRMVMRPINQHFYGKKINHEPILLQETYTPYKDPHPDQILKINGYNIKKTFVSIYRATGRVVWVDQNDALIKSWYLSAGNEEVEGLYDTVAPIDLSLVFGKTAEKENLKKITFSHSENFLSAEWRDYNVYYDPKEMTNIHVIPASPSIKKVLKSINRGDIISIVGYLTDWRGTGKLAHADFKTARFAGEISKDRIGGQASTLCKQLYLMKITLDGYEYE